MVAPREWELDMTRTRAPQPRTQRSSSSRLRQSHPMRADERLGSPALRVGTTVDHFKLIRVLGRGGMGVVYLARDVTLGRKVALKVLRPETLGSRSARRAFLREATITATFNHAHIITIYAVGEHQRAPYLALEYLEGENLFERSLHTPPSPREVARYGVAISQALHEAHGHGVLHRDLKPENVLIPRDGRLRVLDFGVAARVDMDDVPAPTPGNLQADEPRLSDLEIVGTPAYIAPELWRGESATAASDVWSLGVLLFEQVTGTLPFEASSTIDLARSIVEDSPELAFDDDVPDGLRTVIRACLDKVPTGRPTAGAIVADLSAMIDRRGQRPDSDANPFRGLLPFGEDDAPLFFGRDAEIDAFIERLRHVALVPVVGPSGAGKSSFVSAGVIPRLREQGSWRVIRVRPGRQPLTTLLSRLEREGRAAKRSPSDGSFPTVEEVRETPSLLARELWQLSDAEGSRVLLFVDQLEELYTLTDDEPTRRATMEAICGAADDPDGPIRVVFTVRDDFLGRIADAVGAHHALDHVVLLTSPDEEALALTLRKPVEAMGYRFDDQQLPVEMVRAVAGEPSSLPLLQFAGAKLWERRDVESRRVTRAAYDAIGGVEGAVAQHADELLDGLSHEQQRLARQLLLRLVTKDKTRRSVPRQDLVEGLPPASAGVVDRLTDGRIVVSHKRREGPVELELAHESLIFRWGRLARWLEDARDDIAFLRELEEVASGWERRGRHEDEVWQGPVLEEALLRAARCQTVPPRLRAFLDAGKKRRDRTRRRRRWAVTAIVTGLTVASLVLFAKEREAQGERERAENERAVAERQRAVALREGALAAFGRGSFFEARAKIRGSLEADDSVHARAIWWRLLREPRRWSRRFSGFAYDVAFHPDGRQVVVAAATSLQVIDVTTQRSRLYRGPGSQVLATAVSADGRTLAATTNAGEVVVFNVDDGQMRRLGSHRSGSAGVAFTPDGRRLASSGYDGTARLWDVTSGRMIAVLEGHDGPVRNVAISQAGTTLATAGHDETVRLWDLETFETRAVLTGHEGAVAAVAFSPDGDRLASSSRDRTTRLWRLSDHAVERVLRSNGGTGDAVAFDREGNRLAVGGGDGPVTIWDLRAGTRRRLLGHEAGVMGVAFGSDGRWLATASNDHHAAVWDTRALEGQSAGGHAGPIVAVSCSPDGRRIATGADDDDVRLWDAELGATMAVLSGHGDWVRGVDFRPDGAQLASASHDGTVRLWNVDDGVEMATLFGHRREAHFVAFGPDGSRMLSTSNMGEARFWDVASGTGFTAPQSSANARSLVAWSPKGDRAAIGHADGVIEIRHAADGTLDALLEGHESLVFGLAYARDGEIVFSAAWDNTVRRWNVATSESKTLLEMPVRPHGIALAPDGATLAIACADGRIRLHDLESGTTSTLAGHRGEANRVCYLDGARLASVSDDATVRLWDVERRRPLWYATALLVDPPVVVTHDGWIPLGPATTTVAEPLRRALSSADTADQSRHDPESICLTRDGNVELWRGGAAVWSQPATEASTLTATGDGCVVHSGADVHLHLEARDPRLLSSRADALHVTQRHLFVAEPSGIVVFSPGGERQNQIPGAAGVSALATIADRLYVGYRDGTVEARAPDAETIELDLAPSSAVTSIASGPAGTLAVGFANGLFGLWSLADGVRHLHGRLHGAIVRIARSGSELVVVSDLGQHRRLDLAVLERDHCDVLREVWNDVPTVWENGAIVPRPPAPSHPCALRD